MWCCCVVGSGWGGLSAHIMVWYAVATSRPHIKMHAAFSRSLHNALHSPSWSGSLVSVAYSIQKMCFGEFWPLPMENVLLG